MDDWSRLRSALSDAGVAGVEDLGYFVNDTTYLRPSEFDERAAMPVLLRLLHTLTDRDAVAAVAGHLGRQWARPVAFETLHDAFRSWAERDPLPCWKLGASMATCADRRHLPELVAIANDRRFGSARQMVVDALWRFRKDTSVEGVLLGLIDDPDVALHAMSALRRTIGNDAALPHLRRVRDSHSDKKVRWQAAQAVKRAERALARQLARASGRG